MIYDEMKINGHYVVTKGSDDGTFELGDHLVKYENGDIGCKEAAGWITASEIEKHNVSKGIEVEVDKQYYEKIQKQLDDMKI